MFFVFRNLGSRRPLRSKVQTTATVLGSAPGRTPACHSTKAAKQKNHGAQARGEGGGATRARRCEAGMPSPCLSPEDLTTGGLRAKNTGVFRGARVHQLHGRWEWTPRARHTKTEGKKTSDFTSLTRI